MSETPITSSGPLQPIPLAETPGTHERIPPATQASMGRRMALELEHNSTLHELRTTMGDERANAFVSSIGVAALRAAPAGMNVSLGSVVDHTLSRLSREDLASIARGDAGTLNRAQAIAENQVKVAQAAQINQHGAAPAAAPAVDILGRLVHGGLSAHIARMEGGSERTAEGGASVKAASSVYAGDLRAITAQNYAVTPFAAQGLSYENFNALRKEGFNAVQITSAVNTNKELGLEANSNPGATARLQRDVPSAITALHTTRDNWKQVQDLDKAEREAHARGDTETANRIRDRKDEVKRNAEEHDRSEQDRVRREKPKRFKDLKDKQDEIKRAIERNAAKLTPGDVKQAQANVDIIEAYRRNPEDAAARRDYAKLKEATDNDWRQRKAWARIESNLERYAKIEDVEKRRDLANKEADDKKVALRAKVSDANTKESDRSVTLDDAWASVAAHSPKDAADSSKEARNHSDNKRPEQAEANQEAGDKKSNEPSVEKKSAENTAKPASKNSAPILS